MGYDLTRFIGVIDEEFQCSICTMVLEMPLQSPCDHLFCSECIKEWLAVDETCPVDRRSLTSDGLKPPARYFLNMLDKLDIKCTFQSAGCEQLIKLEHLKNHLTSCEYSPDLEVACDKGCGLRVKRCEYQLSCFVHLADRLNSQNVQISNLTHALNGHCLDAVAKLNEQVNQLQAQVSKLRRDVTGQQKHITKLNGELKRLQGLQPQDEKIEKLRNPSTDVIHVLAPLQWRKSLNMKVSTDEANILEFGHSCGSSFAQLLHPLNQENPCFRTQILSYCGRDSVGISIGLTQKGHPTDVPPGQSDGSIGYRCCGKLYYDKCESVTSHACKVSDTIECGIKFTKNFINDGNHSVVVYFSKNGLSFLKKIIKLPVDGLFPTIYVYDVHVATAVRIKYSDCINVE